MINVLHTNNYSSRRSTPLEEFLLPLGERHTASPQALLEPVIFSSPTQRFIGSHSISRINSALAKFHASGKDIDLFKSMIRQETETFLGYQGGSSTVRIFQDIISTIVKDILHIPIPDDFVFLRVPGDPTFSYETASDFLREKGADIPPLNWDTDPDIRQHLVSLNMNLYQSYDAVWDLTPRYYLENATWTHVNVRETLKPFFASLGIDSESVDSLWSEALGLLSHQRGYILQFFDESSEYDFTTQHSYVAYSGGKPHPNHRNHEILFDKSATNFPQLRLIMGNESTLNPFSSIKMKRYDDMTLGERMQYEAKLSSLLAKLPVHPEKVAQMREKLLNLWGGPADQVKSNPPQVDIHNRRSRRRLEQMTGNIDVSGLRKSLLEKTQPFYDLEAIRRPGNPTKIIVPIANLSHLTLTEANLSEIFRLANHHTLNKPYPLGDHPMRIGGLRAYRPNHNGTHSARQVAYIDALFDLIQNQGDADKKSIFNRLSDEEKMSLRLAAYFLRAGRVDESKITDPPPDNYNARSAFIYEQYAKQLGVSPKTIQWTQNLIFNSCKPRGTRGSEIDADPKNKLGYTLLSLVHELDLIRCYSPEKMKAPMKKIKEHLGYFIADYRNRVPKNQSMGQLLQYAKDLCQATGCSRAFDGDPGDRNQFMACSINGDYCWQAVKSSPIPKWR